MIEAEESHAISNALQHKKAIILQNHGILTVGTTIDSALAWFIMLEEQARVILLTGPGAGIPIDDAQVCPGSSSTSWSFAPRGLTVDGTI